MGVSCLAEKESKKQEKISPADVLPDEWIGNDLHYKVGFDGIG